MYSHRLNGLLPFLCVSGIRWSAKLGLTDVLVNVKERIAPHEAFGTIVNRTDIFRGYAETSLD